MNKSELAVLLGISTATLFNYLRTNYDNLPVYAKLTDVVILDVAHHFGYKSRTIKPVAKSLHIHMVDGNPSNTFVYTDAPYSMFMELTTKRTNK